MEKRVYLDKDVVLNEIKNFFSDELDKLPTEIDDEGYEMISDNKTASFLLTLNKHLRKRIRGLEPPHGKWVKTDDGEIFLYHKCSECGAIAHSVLYDDGSEEEILTPYCPWCGTKMENGGVKRFLKRF